MQGQNILKVVMAKTPIEQNTVWMLPTFTTSLLAASSLCTASKKTNGKDPSLFWTSRKKMSSSYNYFYHVLQRFVLQWQNHSILVKEKLMRVTNLAQHPKTERRQSLLKTDTPKISKSAAEAGSTLTLSCKHIAVQSKENAKFADSSLRDINCLMKSVVFGLVDIGEATGYLIYDVRFCGE